MQKVKCYGGPMHGESVRLDAGCNRFECPEPKLVLRRLRSRARDHASADLLLGIPPTTYRRMSYFVHTWRMEGRTSEGARVYRDKMIALLDGCDLTERERCEMDQELDWLPWKWTRKPNFLKEFDQWFEYTLCEVTGRQPKVRY